ncbi:MAG: tetratricopeptide repeat protein [Verrucomicrobia bacterium]|nr:tetratricopeptide repeat protein [Verrucomicrobiota bacterium]
MKASLTVFLCAGLLLHWGAGCGAWAHEGPEHEIEELTEEINKRGESADLLIQRAVEYRVLGKNSEALRDLERAVRLEPGSLVAHRELSVVLFASGKTNEALSTVTRTLAMKSDEPVEVGGLHILRAEILKARDDFKKALEDCDKAIAMHAANPEWYFLRSEVQNHLKLHKERIKGLDAGIKATGSGLLEIEKIEALLDAEEFCEAIKQIESELASSRVQSSWLIRRARARIGMGQKAEAVLDLKSAIDEIGVRLNLASPDVPLLLDKALAHELLEEVEEAHQYYEQARDAGAGVGVRAKIKALKARLDEASKAKQ